MNPNSDAQHSSDGEVSDASASAAVRLLTELEARILASLFEKAQTTPEQYPLTVNSLQLACNQKNNRDPITQFEQGAIVHALRDLENRGWARQSSEGVRAQRWEHRFDQHLNLTPRKTLRQDDFIQSVADALQYISYYHPVDYIKPRRRLRARGIARRPRMRWRRS
jgi:hypothetical protein